MNKQEYETDPKVFWNTPTPEIEAIFPVPTESDNPLWVKYVLPEIIINRRHELCLDLGCGGGRYIVLTARHFDKVIGIDFSVCNLEKAAKYAHANDVRNVEFFEANLGNIGIIPNESVDFAYSVAVFMHMPNETKRRALKELRRVLKPEGRVVLIEIVPIIAGAFDCPDIEQGPWQDMIKEAGLTIETIGPADPFTKYKLLRRE